MNPQMSPYPANRRGGRRGPGQSPGWPERPFIPLPYRSGAARGGNTNKPATQNGARSLSLTGGYSCEMNRSSKRADESADVSLPSGRAERTAGARAKPGVAGTAIYPAAVPPGSGPGRQHQQARHPKRSAQPIQGPPSPTDLQPPSFFENRTIPTPLRIYQPLFRADESAAVLSGGRRYPRLFPRQAGKLSI